MKKNGLYFSGKVDWIFNSFFFTFIFLVHFFQIILFHFCVSKDASYAMAILAKNKTKNEFQF